MGSFGLPGRFVAEMPERSVGLGNELWAAALSKVAGNAREGRHEKSAPTEVIGCILLPARMPKTEILIKIATVSRRKEEPVVCPDVV